MLEQRALSSTLFLVRLSGEITTKAKATRQQFARRLVQNLSEALRSYGEPFQVRRTWSRIYVEAPAEVGRAVLPRIFGIQSFSEVKPFPWEGVETLLEKGTELYKDRVKGRTFAVRARRLGDRRFIGFSTMDVEKNLGAALYPFAKSVDLGNPEVKVQVEVTEETMYFFTSEVSGPAGLPMGTEGRALALMSGGFDSAVASWELLKRGVQLDYLFCNLGGEEHRLGVLRVLKMLVDGWSAGSRPRLHSVDLRPAVAEIQAKCHSRYWQILLKRLMYRAAEIVAEDIQADAIITGEAVGQVSSQTLPNLRVISEVVSRPMFRPLIGRNKNEILKIARAIGTFDLSKVVPEYCGLAAKKPATRAKVEPVRREESELDLSAFELQVSSRKVESLRDLSIEVQENALAQNEEIPESAVWVDLRDTRSYGLWHPEGAIHLEYFEALKAWKHFAKDNTYVLYCEVGLKSGHLADAMRQEGYQVWHIRGGMRELISRQHATRFRGSAIEVS